MNDVLDKISENQGSPCVIYYRQANTSVTDSELDKITEGIGCKIDVCDSWQWLTTRLTSISESSSPIPLIILDITLFNSSTSTVLEIVNMISTLRRCLEIPVDIRIGVVTETICDSAVLKDLQNNDILGVVPISGVFGHDSAILAIRELLNNRSYWSKSTIEQVTGYTEKAPSNKDRILTNRQSQVLALVKNRGLSNKRIALALHISESTVKIHISSILKHFGVQNRTQLVLASGSGMSASNTVV